MRRPTASEMTDNYFIDRVRDLANRIEEALRKLEARTEQIIEMRGELSHLQRSVDQVWRLLRGEGIDRPGLQQQVFTLVQRVEELEKSIEDFDSTPGRLTQLEMTVRQLDIEVQRLVSASGAMAVEDKKGEWALRVDTTKQKLVIVGVVVGAMLASNPLWKLLEAVWTLLKK